MYEREVGISEISSISLFEISIGVNQCRRGLRPESKLNSYAARTETAALAAAVNIKEIIEISYMK